MELKEIESAIEGVLFAAGEPVGVERLCLALDIDRITADSVCQRLADAYRYERRGIRLVRLDNSYHEVKRSEIISKHAPVSFLLFSSFCNVSSILSYCSNNLSLLFMRIFCSRI